MANRGYKKYMKANSKKDYNLIQLFVISFVIMLALFTVLIKLFSPSVDVSIGEDQTSNETETTERSSNVDGRLSNLQEEDRGMNFTDMMKSPSDVQNNSQGNVKTDTNTNSAQSDVYTSTPPAADPVYKVYIGSYTSAEQARVAKEIITESGSNLSPIVKCLGSNNYTLQVGIFRSRSSADGLLNSLQNNNIPGRIVQEY